MATDTEYRALDAAYRAGSARIALVVAQAMLAEWAKVDADNLAGTSKTWLERAIQATVAGHRAVAGLANLYTERVRELSIPEAPPWNPPPTVQPNLEQIRKSLIYTGLASTGQEIARLEAQASGEFNPDDFPDEMTLGEMREIAARDQMEATEVEARKRQLMQNAITRAAGAALRHVTNGGRDQLDENIAQDPLALGYYRTTKPGCCAFCAMLASRGAVYTDDSFEASDARFEGPGEHKIHDHCGCGMRPIYTRKDPLPDNTSNFEALWIEVSKSTRGGNREQQREFRRRYEATLTGGERAA